MMGGKIDESKDGGSEARNRLGDKKEVKSMNIKNDKYWKEGETLERVKKEMKNRRNRIRRVWERCDESGDEGKRWILRVG